MDTAILPFIGAVSPIVPWLIAWVAATCLVTSFFLRKKLAIATYRKIQIGICIAMIVAQILWVDWFYSFAWGLLLIFNLHRLGKEKIDKPPQSK